MDKYFAFYEKDPMMIDRESLHREIRNLLDETNLPNCHKAYLALIEDVYIGTLTMSILYDMLKDMSPAIPPRILDECAQLIADHEKRLAKWEQQFLRDSFCSGESCE